MNTSALDTLFLDRTVAAVRGSAGSWSATPLPERIALLERLLPRGRRTLRRMVRTSSRVGVWVRVRSWCAGTVLGLGPIVSSRGMKMYAHMHSTIQFALGGAHFGIEVIR
ncbi:hypothetical protein ACH4U5_08920 [Streptomyces sp. NPDC020858]|uniref:hypothetical protein n=1 Tax=Streptomyces sp. NPDC020858 TaxID=3365097 RepID=UPI0037B00F97